MTDTTTPGTQGDAVRVAAQALAQAAQQGLRLNRIAQLIGAIYVYGDFKAETMHEQELEQLLRENGTFWETVADYEKWLLDENALVAPPVLLRVEPCPNATNMAEHARVDELMGKPAPDHLSRPSRPGTAPAPP